jgi:hypothetical protein
VRLPATISIGSGRGLAAAAVLLLLLLVEEEADIHCAMREGSDRGCLGVKLWGTLLLMLEGGSFRAAVRRPA